MIDEKELRKFANSLISKGDGGFILALLDELQSLRSERTAWRVTAENAEKDAERYRHLRDSTLVDGEINESMFVAIDSPDWPNRWALVGEELDAAIDAAISSTQEQT